MMRRISDDWPVREPPKCQRAGPRAALILVIDVIGETVARAPGSGAGPGNSRRENGLGHHGALFPARNERNPVAVLQCLIRESKSLEASLCLADNSLGLRFHESAPTPAAPAGGFCAIVEGLSHAARPCDNKSIKVRLSRSKDGRARCTAASSTAGLAEYDAPRRSLFRFDRQRD